MGDSLQGLRVTVTPGALAELMVAARKIDDGTMPTRAPGATVQRGTTRQHAPAGRRAGSRTAERGPPPDDPDPRRRLTQFQRGNQALADFAAVCRALPARERRTLLDVGFAVFTRLGAEQIDAERAEL